jgi:hypothetical protein
MSRPKRPQKVRTKTGEAPERKSLPLLKFEEHATTVLRDLFASLPIAFTHEDLIREIRSYLDLSVKEIRLRGKLRMKVKAIDFPKYPNPPHWGENNEILEQADFKDAERLYIDENLITIEEAMQLLRAKVRKLSISWDFAVPIIKKIADKCGPDARPASVQRGEFGEHIIQELRRIREGKLKLQSFEELESAYPRYEVVRILKNKAFDQEDRVLLTQPNQWERVVTYATGILARHFKKSQHTIKQDRKQFSAWARDQAPQKHR